jgi:hypothetical protein
MRRINVKAQNDYAEIAGLHFFAQCLDELLFDHSDDSYKAPALSTLSRTIELQRLSAINDEASIGAAALEAFVDELEWSIKEDQAITAHQRALCVHHVATLRSKITSPERHAQSLSAIRLVLSDYFKGCIEQLRQLVLKQPNERRRIVALSSILVSQAEIEGFSRRYCYHMNQKMIRRLQSNLLIQPETILEKFFESFQRKRQRFSVAMSAGSGILRFADLAEAFRCSIHPKGYRPIEGNDAAIREFSLDADNYEAVVFFEDLEAVEPISARDQAYEIFSLMLSSIGMKHHDVRIDVGQLALVKSNDSRLIINVGTRPDAMHRNKKSPQESSIVELKKFSEILAGRHLTSASTQRFINAVFFHQAALRSKDEHNQLVDLWAAIEGLLPPPGKDSPRIRFFVANLIAPLTLTYAEKLFQRALDELLNSDCEEAINVMNSIQSGSNQLEKLVSLLVSQEHEEERKKLAECLKKPNPLLLHRFWDLSERFKSAKRIRATLISHRTKVKWHIERIYSTRNSIMHNAEALPYLDTLVENLHGYVDTLLFSIAEIARQAPTKTGINTILEYILAYEAHVLSTLDEQSKSQDGLPCSTSNFFSLVFGDNNPIAPSKA